MSTKPYVYDFDPTGALAANRIENELHLINPGSGSDFDIIIPQLAPFFLKGLVVKHVASGVVLTEGMHYDVGYKFEAASTQLATPIYAAVVITDRTLNGRFQLTYQTLGGEWTLDSQTILEIIGNAKNDPRTVKWDDIIDLPSTFPPIDHTHSADDVVGMDDVRDAILQVATSVSESAAKALNALLEHVRDHANPHAVSLEQLGLSDIGDLTEATVAEVNTGTNATHYISPRRLQYFLSSKVTGLLDDHIENVDNPHKVTAEQVGLGQVGNFPMATLSEAIAGTLNTRYMSPATTKALITEQIKNAISDIGDVSKDGIGLGNVENYAIATREEAIAGTLNTRYMTPLRVAQHVTPAIEAAMKAHLAATNPHGITATTVGLGNVPNYAAASTSDVNAGTAKDKLVTVADVTSMVSKASGESAGAVAGDLKKHISDYENPHKTSAAQVGLSLVSNFPVATEQQVQDRMAKSYLTPANLYAKLWVWLAGRVSGTGRDGQVPFVSGNATTGGYSYEALVTRKLLMIEDDADLVESKKEANHTPIYDVTSQKLYTWNNGLWKTTTNASSNVSPGRIYFNKMTGKTFFAEAATEVYCIAKTSGGIASVSTGDSYEIVFTGDGSPSNPLVASLTGKTSKTFTSDDDLVSTTTVAPVSGDKHEDGV